MPVEFLSGAGPVTLIEGDCREVLAGLPEASVDAVVTDPPYHLASIVKRFGPGQAPAQHGRDGLFARAARGFMGQSWDGGDIAFDPALWAAVLRVLKPGGHLLAFSHSKTYAHMQIAVEAAGFEARDSILNLYAADPAWAAFLESLTPDQMDGLGRALASSDAPLLAWLYGCGFPKSHDVAKGIDKLMGAERDVVATRPADDITGGQLMKKATSGESRPPREIAITAPATPEAAAWEGWGTALKPAFEPILVARKPLTETSVARQVLATGTGGLNIDGGRVGKERVASYRGTGVPRPSQSPSMHEQAIPEKVGEKIGRWLANVTHDASAEVRARFPADPSGTVARFFYSAKADATDRQGSRHPTVKPQTLMRWLVRLVTPPGALVLDPFGGSGSTGWAAHREGRRALLIEREPDYAAHIRQRIAGLDRPRSPETGKASRRQPDLFEVRK
ncbi:DNA modification methylase [Roseovarius sp. MBR-154]|jgi:site-specific DNA-methyltransferase (adenine-specific)